MASGAICWVDRFSVDVVLSDWVCLLMDLLMETGDVLRRSFKRLSGGVLQYIHTENKHSWHGFDVVDPGDMPLDRHT